MATKVNFNEFFKEFLKVCGVDEKFLENGKENTLAKKIPERVRQILFENRPEEILRLLANGDFDYVNTPAGFPYKFIEAEGGGEGGGEYCHGVFEFNGKFYKAEWSYYSYDGCDYSNIVDTLCLVQPVERMVTFYE